MSRAIAAAWIGLLSLALSGECRAQQVVDVEVQGELRRVAKSLVLSTVGLEPGVELSLESVQQAMRDLQALNVFDDIRVYKLDVPGGVKLIFEVVEHPALEGTRFKGNKNVKEKDMEEALGLVSGQVIAPKDVARGRQKILALYREKGYLRAEVAGDLFQAEEKGKVFLQYDIDEGEKVKVRKVNILNNEAFDNGKITKQMETKKKRWWRKGEFKVETFADDKEKILAFYRSKGYQQASIVRDSIYYDDSKKNLFIDIEMDEGIQYYLGELSWEGNELFSEKELVDKLRIKTGDIYQYSDQDLAWLVQSAYWEKGYLDTQVIPQEELRGDRADIKFQIFEGHPWRIRRINIAGNTKTRENVIRRELELRPGDIYQQNLVQESMRRVYMLNFFKEVQPLQENSNNEEERLVDLTFQVEERRTGQLMVGVGYSDRDKAVGQTGIQMPNFRGKGQRLDFNWEFGTRRETLLVGFTEPWLFDTPTNLSIRLYTLNQQYFNYYDRRLNSASIRLGRRLQKPSYSTLSVGYQLRDEKYFDFADGVDSNRFRPITTSSFELVYQRDTRDLAQFPTKGTLFTYRPEIATAVIGGDVDFHRHEVEFNYYRPSWWKFVWSLETKVAVIDGFSSWDDRNISTFERFSPGGVDWWDGQVRGYEDRSLGPRTDTGIPIGGTSMMVMNLEYRFPVAEQQVYGIMFADAGNAWTNISDLNPLKLRRSVGFGFRVMTPMGLLGFDFGYGFDRKKVDGSPASWNTHFQIGPQFF